MYGRNLESVVVYSNTDFRSQITSFNRRDVEDLQPPERCTLVLPIAPHKPNPYLKDCLLRLEGGRQLHKPSYVYIEEVPKLPLKALTPTEKWFGCNLRLTRDSLQCVLAYIRKTEGSLL